MTNRSVLAGLRISMAITLSAFFGCGESDQGELDELAQEIEQLIGTPSCSTSDVCAVIGFGDKPCGGPKEFLVYSTETTDSDVLTQRVDEYNQIEEAFNESHQVISTCDMVPIPEVECSEGICAATTSN